MKYYLVIIPFLFLSLAACINQPPVEIENQTPIDISISDVPKLTVNQALNGPNQQLLVTGADFPANQVVVIYYADSETNLGPAVAQVVSGLNGDFELELLTPTAWPGADFRGETRLLIVAEAVDTTAMASAPIVIEYEDALLRYENSTAGYVVDIPTTWATTEPQNTPLGELVLMGLAPISPGNPSNSMVISADPNLIDEAAAAQYLICGEPNCTEDVTFELTTINGLDAKSLIIGTENTPDLEWFFIRYADRLIYFTLHDPLTLETLDGLVQSFALIEKVSSSFTSESTVAQSDLEITEESSTPLAISTSKATPTPKATATKSATPEPTNQPTDEPTAVFTPLPTATATQSPTTVPTATPSPTAEPSATPQPTQTSTLVPTPTVPATKTPTPTLKPTTAPGVVLGPLQTSLDLLTILSRDQEDEEALSYFTQNALQSISGPNDILSFFLLDRKPFTFQAERLAESTTIRMRISPYAGTPIAVRDLNYALENGRWRIDSISIVESAEPVDPAETAEPVDPAETVEPIEPEEE